MGVVITKNAAIADILADLRTAVDKAASRGGVWSEEAQKVLANPAVRAFGADEALEQADEALRLERIALELAVRAADLGVANAHDALWNRLDRPKDHPELEVIIPSPLREFTSQPPGDKPQWLDAMAQMLEEGLLSEVPLQDCVDVATELRARSAALVTVLERWEKARKQRTLKNALRKGYVRAARIQLVHLKRIYKARGKSEADIHRVIPDRKKYRPKAAIEEAPVEPEIPSKPVPRALVSVAPAPADEADGPSE